MDNNTESFLSVEEEKAVVDAISLAEKETSGELRVHIEGANSKAPLQRAAEVFHFLEMDKTKDRNGVLIYIATDDHTFAIYGDKGINKVVPNDFWDTIRDVIQSHFENKEFKQGIVSGILKAGKVLRECFPYNHNDINELPDTISKG